MAFQVRIAIHKPTKTPYALKALHKGHLISTNQVANTVNEKKIMRNCHHPLILKCYATFNQKTHINLLLGLAQGGELAPSKKLMAAAKLSRGSSLLRWRRRGNLRQEPEVDDGVVWHIRVAPGAWRAVITELVAQGKDVACDFFFERK